VRDSFSRRETLSPSWSWTLSGSQRPWSEDGPHWSWPRFGRPIGQPTQAGPQLARVSRWGHVFERYNGPTCPFGLYGSF
jgi:hypothetical protein